MTMNTIAAKIKSLLGMPIPEIPEDEPKRNPYPNGPATYKTMTNGQIRRMRARAQRRAQVKGFKEQRRNYISRESERAVLRAMLQVLGFIPYVDHQKPSPSKERMVRAGKWVHENYGSLDKALERYEHLSGEKVSA